MNGIGFKFSKSNFNINLIAGDIEIRKSAPNISAYNPRIPNYFTSQSIYGADLNDNLLGFNYGLSILSVEEDRRDVYHSLSNLRFEKIIFLEIFTCHLLERIQKTKI